MEEDNKDEEGIIVFGEYEKIITFPTVYDDLINNILSLFNIPENKKSLLLISYKSLFGDSVNIYSQEEYDNYLQKLSQNDVENILSVCIQESIRNLRSLQAASHRREGPRPAPDRHPRSSQTAKCRSPEPRCTCRHRTWTGRHC